MGECTKETAFSILDFFHKSGGNFIDTANAYQAGQSELWLGEWMKERETRDQMVVATKFTTNYQSYKGFSGRINSNYTGNGLKSLHLSVEASLDKLQTTYIDILYVHCMYTV
jgi:aryl-alcohol dehydrogenase-like predicted oxidoreductase